MLLRFNFRKENIEDSWLFCIVQMEPSAFQFVLIVNGDGQIHCQSLQKTEVNQVSRHDFGYRCALFSMYHLPLNFFALAYKLWNVNKI